jgi:cytochrome c
MMKTDAQEGASITPTNVQDKFDAGGKAMILFLRDEKKRIVKLQMEAMGMKFNGEKE